MLALWTAEMRMTRTNPRSPDRFRHLPLAASLQLRFASRLDHAHRGGESRTQVRVHRAFSRIDAVSNERVVQTFRARRA